MDDQLTACSIPSLPESGWRSRLRGSSSPWHNLKKIPTSVCRTEPTLLSAWVSNLLIATGPLVSQAEGNKSEALEDRLLIEPISFPPLSMSSKVLNWLF